MRFSTLATVAAAVVTVSAQKTINVIVGGNGGLTYNPANFTADVGDTVTFQFQSKNHTVSQSTFANPCEQLVNTSISDPAQQQLTSGFRPVAANATSFPTWSIQITQTTPIWFFCAQTGHCAKGMVGAINANESSANTFEAFLAKATATTGGTGTSSTTGSVSETSTPSGTSSGSSPSGSETAGTNGAVINVPHGAMGGILVSLVGLALGLTL